MYLSKIVQADQYITKNGMFNLHSVWILNEGPIP